MYLAETEILPDIKPWKKDYSTGIEIIDKQHREIIDTLNDLYAAISMRKKSDARYLLDLVVKMRRHIITENNILSNNLYKDPTTTELIKEHIKKNNNIVDPLVDNIRKYLEGEDVTIELAILLRSWVNHMEEDVYLLRMINVEYVNV